FHAVIGLVGRGSGDASEGNRRNSSGDGYASTMTQEADRSPAQAGAGAVRGSARPPAATPGTAPQQSPDGAPRAGQAPGNGPAPGAGQARGGGRRGAGGRSARKPQGRPSLGGGTPAQDRELRAQGRETVRKLLEAGTIEFEERGVNGGRVDDVVKRAGISHGTFYLYFANKGDLFKALLRDTLHDMEVVTGDFPVVTTDDTGVRLLRAWVRKFSAAYAAHGTVLRTLSSANAPGEMYADGLQLFFSLTEAIATGMTA